MVFKEEDVKNETLKSRIAGHLECPVCLHIPDTSPVFQCNNGHTICCRCRVKLSKCPICRVPLGYSRSLTSEKLISLLSLAHWTLRQKFNWLLGFISQFCSYLDCPVIIGFMYMSTQWLFRKSNHLAQWFFANKKMQEYLINWCKSVFLRFLGKPQVHLT